MLQDMPRNGSRDDPQAMPRNGSRGDPQAMLMVSIGWSFDKAGMERPEVQPGWFLGIAYGAPGVMVQKLVKNLKSHIDISIVVFPPVPVWFDEKTKLRSLTIDTSAPNYRTTPEDGRQILRFLTINSSEPNYQNAPTSAASSGRFRGADYSC